jgi:2,3-bisphosphoglycerate-independent phosphoglycerate mutase
VGGADEAAHARQPETKAAVLAAADRELVAPLAAEVGERGGRIQIGPDHGCDPRTGQHVGGPVPHIVWSAG